ncbi:hypothetical protein U1Q18_014762, partial [Sarracenia purpurea var. burkii]
MDRLATHPKSVERMNSSNWLFGGAPSAESDDVGALGGKAPRGVDNNPNPEPSSGGLNITFTEQDDLPVNHPPDESLVINLQ